MKERGILFSAPMVLALLAGRKTQTRRVVKAIELRGGIKGVRVGGPAFCYLDFDGVPGLSWRPYGTSPTVPYPPEKVAEACPFGQPGDRLWVRETAIIAPKRWASPGELRAVASESVRMDGDGDARLIQYLATSPDREAADDFGLKATPSIFMPRWASRITLEVTGIRVERVQSISREDALAEGVDLREEKWPDSPQSMPLRLKPQYAFEVLWKDINGPESWAANPWVWVVEFRRVEPALSRIEIEAALEQGRRDAEAVRQAWNRGGFRP